MFSYRTRRSGEIFQIFRDLSNLKCKVGPRGRNGEACARAHGVCAVTHMYEVDRTRLPGVLVDFLRDQPHQRHTVLVKV